MTVLFRITKRVPLAAGGKKKDLRLGVRSEYYGNGC